MVNVSGRRGRVVHEAILKEALDLLSEVGYSEFKIEQVAARAGVHKTTVYRRWSDRESLLTEAVLTVATEEFTIPNTGDIDLDVLTAARQRVDWFIGPYGQPLIRMLTSDASHLPGAHHAITHILDARYPHVIQRLRDAADLNQLPPSISPDLFLSTLLAPLYFKLLVTRANLTQDDAERAAAVTLAAARGHLLDSAPN